MISCTIERGQNVNIEIHGHAGYNPGNDIVCAAASVLAYTLCDELSEYSAEHKVNIEKMEIESGDISLSFHISKRDYLEVESALRFFTTGFQLLAGEYPDNVDIDFI